MSRKTKILAVALTAIMVLSVFAYAPAAATADASTQANTLLVDDDHGADHNDDIDDDNEYETIQGAVNDAEPGDTIEVAPGTYNENVMVDVGDIVIEGVGSSQVTVVGVGNGNATVTLGADDIDFRGFTVEANESEGTPALMIYDLIENSHVKGVLVENNVFVGHDSTAILAMATPPSGTNQARDLTIRNNEFTGGTVGSMDWGLFLNAKSSLLEDNTFSTKVELASVFVTGPSNTLNNTEIQYPGYGFSGLWIAPGGQNTMVNTLDVDGHPDEHLHQDEERGDWLRYGVYVDGSGSTLTDVNAHESHVGIYVGGEEGVSDVTLRDSVAHENLNHDLEIQYDSRNVHVENFEALSTTKPAGSQAAKYASPGQVYPTYGVNVLVHGGSNHMLSEVTSTNEFPIGIAMLDTEDSTVDNAVIQNKGPGEAVLRGEAYQDSTTGIYLDESDDNTISNSLVTDNDVGVAIYDGDGNALVGNNPGIYNNSDVGIELWEADNTHLEDNDVRNNTVGLNATDSDVRAMYNNFVDNGAGIHAAWDSHVNATWNWFGAANGPSGPATDGVLSGSGDSITADATSEIPYDPFLTAGKDEVEQDPDKTKQFAHDLVTNGSQGVQTFATPGPATVSIQVSQQDAMVWTYDGGFTVLNSPSVQAETLRAWGISNLAHGENARVVIDFSDTGPSTPGSESLENGWNFVASPQYGDADDVMQMTAERERIAQGYDQFDSQPFSISPPVTTMPFAYPFDTGTNEPRLSAYAGYWVYVDGSGELIAAVPSGVTISEEEGLIKA